VPPAVTGFSPEIQTLMALKNPMMEDITTPLTALAQARSNATSSTAKRKREEEEQWLLSSNYMMD
jgi:hypothetical protein